VGDRKIAQKIVAASGGNATDDGAERTTAGAAPAVPLRSLDCPSIFRDCVEAASPPHTATQCCRSLRAPGAEKEGDAAELRRCEQDVLYSLASAAAVRETTEAPEGGALLRSAQRSAAVRAAVVEAVEVGAAPELGTQGRRRRWKNLCRYGICTVGGALLAAAVGATAARMYGRAKERERELAARLRVALASVVGAQWSKSVALAAQSKSLAAAQAEVSALQSRIKARAPTASALQSRISRVRRVRHPGRHLIPRCPGSGQRYGAGLASERVESDRKPPSRRPRQGGPLI
jgi:hypothetical protein